MYGMPYEKIEPKIKDDDPITAFKNIDIGNNPFLKRT
jgi:hypothetical protein